MRQFFRKLPVGALVFSIAVHALAALIFIFLKLGGEASRTVEVFIQLPSDHRVQPATQPIDYVERLAEPVVPEIKTPQRQEPVIEEEVVQLDTLAVDSVEKFDRMQFFGQSPQLSFKQPLENMHVDSLDTLNINPIRRGASLFSDSIFSHSPPDRFADRIQRDQYQKNMGHTPTVPLGQALGQGAQVLSNLFNKEKEDRPVRLDFIPSEVELNILETIWQNSGSTDSEIYAALDTSIRITAVDLNSVLEKLEQKGIVKRQLVSPQQLFSFPVGQVEMSRKNRRNRVYHYQAKINADDVLRYLQAVLYETEFSQAGSDSTRLKQVENLRKKVMRLIEAKG